MPLYRVEVTAEVYVWSEKENSLSVPDEVDKEHLHTILRDLNDYDYGIDAFKVMDLKEVPKELRSSCPYGEEDKTIEELMNDQKTGVPE